MVTWNRSPKSYVQAALDNPTYLQERGDEIYKIWKVYSQKVANIRDKQDELQDRIDKLNKDAQYIHMRMGEHIRDDYIKWQTTQTEPTSTP